MMRAAAAAYPEEACGLLVGRRIGGRILATSVTVSPNVAPPAERSRRFVVDPLHLMSTETQADADGLELVGSWHSHPDAPAIPSEADIESLWPSSVQAIVSVTGGEPCRPRVFLASSVTSAEGGGEAVREV